MVRKCRNPWCQGTGKVHRAAFAFCRACWGLAGIVFAGLVFADVLEAWRPWAPWAFVALAALAVAGWGVWFAVAGRRVNVKAAGKLEEADVPSAGSGKRFRRWSGAAAFLVLVLLALKLAKDVVVGATLDVLSMLR